MEYLIQQLVFTKAERVKVNGQNLAAFLHTYNGQLEFERKETVLFTWLLKYVNLEMYLICTLSTWDKLQSSNERNKIPSEHIDPGVFEPQCMHPLFSRICFPWLLGQWWKWPGGGAICVPWHFIHLSVISVLGPGQWQPDSPGASGVKSNYIHYLKEVRSLTFSVHNKTSMSTLHGHRVVSQANQCHCPTRKIICIDILQPLTNKIYLFLFYVCVCLHIFKCTCMQCP